MPWSPGRASPPVASCRAATALLALLLAGCSQWYYELGEPLADNGLAPGDTPVSRGSTIPVPIDVSLPSGRGYSPLPSRIAHLTVIDILAAGVSRARGASGERHLARLQRGLQSLRRND